MTNRGEQRRGEGGPAGLDVSQPELAAIISQGDAASLNGVANRLGKYYASGFEREKLSFSQIRNVLDRLQRMGSYDPNQLQLLRPLLAYAAGRHGGKVKHLQGVVDQAIQRVDSKDSFEHFKSFFEAIVAYHRYHGGK